MKDSKWIKYYHRLRNGEKIPRKAKKEILGLKLSKSKLRKKIKQFKVIHKARTIYELDETTIKPFCPYCGCELTRSTGNMAEYPELWDRVYCLRCDELVEEADNSVYHHILEEMKDNEF